MHCVSLRCKMCWFDTCAYCQMFTEIGLVNTLFRSHDYHSVVALMVRIFKVCSHSNFKVYNTESLITVTMLYNRCLELIPHITGSLYPLNNISLSPICPSCRQPPFCSVLFPILPLSEIIRYSHVTFNNRNMSLEMCC